MSFEDTILLRLKRQYSKDEHVGLIIDKLREVETECGILRSELDECRFISKERKMEIGELKVRISQLEKIKGISSQLAEQEYVMELKNQIKTRQATVKRLRNDNRKLISIICELRRKIKEG